MMYRDLEGAYSNFIVGVQYAQAPTCSQMRAFLAGLCQTWSQLCLQVYEHRELRPLAQITYENVVDTVETDFPTVDAAAASILHDYNSLVFPLGVASPLWRIVLYRETVFFVCNHVLFDGTSGKIFHDHLAAFMQDPKSSDSHLLFSLGNGFSIDPSPIALLSSLMPPKTWKAPAAVSNAYPNFEESLLDSPLFRHRSTFHHISKKDTAKLLELARANDIKLTALLYGAVNAALAAADILPDAPLTTLIPVNMRPFVGDKSREYPYALLFGKWVPAVDKCTIPPPGPSPAMWLFCQEFQSGLARAIPQSFYPMGAGEYAFEANPDVPMLSMKTLASRAKNINPTHTTAMSNIGALRSPLVLRAWFDQPTVDAAFACHIIGANGLSLNLMGHRGISETHYKNYVAAVIAAIDALL